MTQMLKRALPFILTFVLGVIITAIVGGISPIRHKRLFDNGRPRCNWKSQTVEVWELQNPSDVLHMGVPVRGSHSPILTSNEPALILRAMQNDARPGRPRFVVSYVAPETIDGRPYTSNVMLSNIRRPAFWDDERENKQTPACDTMVRVDLDASGTVTRAEPVPGYGDQCPHLTDILDAAKEISFSPAMRDGVPVTVRMSLMYSTRERRGSD